MALSHAVGSSDAGRFAVAATDISPGDAVLVAAPYYLVYDPSEYCSGLYLAARAVPANEFHGGSAASGGETPSSPSSSSSAPCRKKKAAAVHRDSTPADPREAKHYVSSHATRCSECFREIPAGSALLNYAAIASLSVDISAEQEELQELLNEEGDNEEENGEEKKKNNKKKESANHKRPGSDDVDHDNSRDSAATAAADKRLKKPTRSSKMKADSVVELKSKLCEMARTQRAALLYEHRLRKRQQRERQRQEGEDAPSSGAALHGFPSCWRRGCHASDGSSPPPCRGFAACEGCGTVCYCSPRCWAEGHARHVASGECGVLRWVYPLMMREYFWASSDAATGVPKGRGGGGKGWGAGPVLLPGEEPLYWARSANGERSFEAQCMLMMCLLMAASGREGSTQPGQPSSADGEREDGDFGVAAHWGRTLTKVEEAELQARSRDGAALQQQQQQQEPRRKDGDAALGGAGVSRAIAVESQVLPKEVLTMQDGRIRLGLAGKVEVMDADSAKCQTDLYRSASCDADKKRALSHRILLRDDGDDDEDGDGGGSSFLTASPLSEADDECGARGGGDNSNEGGDTHGGSPPRQRVRVPRYADMAAMTTNLCVLSKERRGCYGRYYRRFVKRFLPWMITVTVYQARMAPQAREDGEEGGGEDAILLFPIGSDGQRYLLHWAEKLREGGGEGGGGRGGGGEPLPDSAAPPLASLEAVLTEAYFARVFAASQCNTFGVYSSKDKQIAFGAYPEASYFNHSCLPNLCRSMGKGGRTAAFYALRPISSGEPLTICYTHVEETNTAERRRCLLETYRFFCVCERCSGVATLSSSSAGNGDADIYRTHCYGGGGSDSEAAMVKGCPVALCKQCPVRGYLRPLGPAGWVNAEPPRAWGWESVKERQCTVCSQRYPLNGGE